jgi:hypothetical protein
MTAALIFDYAATWLTIAVFVGAAAIVVAALVLVVRGGRRER